MKDNVSTQNGELELSDVFRILFSKIKAIICIALVAAVLGASLGAAKTLLGKNYGATLEFYITPEAPDSNLLLLLSSDRFAEKLLLNEYGLPEGEGADYDAAVAAKAAADKASENLVEAIKLSKEAPNGLAKVQKIYEEKQKAYDEAYALLKIYKEAGDAFYDNENHIEKTELYENNLSEAKLAKDKAEKAYYEASQKVIDASINLEKAEKEVIETRKVYDDLSEKLIDSWREKPENKSKIALVSNSIAFEHVQDTAKSNNAEASASGRQFLIVKVNTGKDKALASELVDSLRRVLPSYVAENTNVSESGEEVRCTLLSTVASVYNLSSDSLVKEAIKFGVLVCLGAVAIACVVFVFSDVRKSEKTDCGETVREKEQVGGSED